MGVDIKMSPVKSIKEKTVSKLAEWKKEVTVLSVIMALLRTVFIIGVSYIILHPLFTKISTSLMTTTDIFDPAVRWIPRVVTFEHYATVWEALNYPVTFTNSMLLTVMVALLQLFSCTLVAYGLARFDFRGSKLIFGLVIFVLVVPPQMFMIPLYLNFRYFNLFGLLGEEGYNLLGSYLPFILTSITASGLRNGLFIYIMRQFFKGMPRDLEEAAYVDGAGLFKTFFRIMLPGAVPGLVIVFLFAFVWQWNDYFFVTLFMGSGGNLLVQALDNLAIEVLDDPLSIEGGYATIVDNTGMIMFIAPLLFLYIFMQRYFIESIQRTGLVG